MGIPPIKKAEVLTRENLWKLLDPGRVFYRPVVDDVISSGNLAEINTLLKGAKAVQAKYGDLPALIKQLEAAAKRAQ